MAGTAICAAPTTSPPRLEQCWTWGNGWLKDGSDPGSQANGNGFKMGGGDNSNSAQLTHHFILKNCLAFGNKAKGFDQNNNAGSMTLLNCTSFGNGSNKLYHSQGVEKRSNGHNKKLPIV